MKLRHEWQTYRSKIATFISFLKGGIIGFIIFLLIFFIPAFICLFFNLKAYVVGGLFGFLGVAAIISYVLFLIFVDENKIDEKIAARKEKKNKEKVDK